MSSKSESEELELEPPFNKKLHSCKTAHLKVQNDVLIKTFIHLRDNWPKNQFLSNKEVIDKTANELGVSTRTVYRILREYQKTNDAIPILRRKRMYKQKCRKKIENFAKTASRPDPRDASQVVETNEGMSLQPHNIQMIEKPGTYYKADESLEEITSLDRSISAEEPQESLLQTTLKSMLLKPSKPPLYVIVKMLHNPNNSVWPAQNIPQSIEPQIKIVEKNSERIYLHPIVMKDGILTAPSLPKHLFSGKMSSLHTQVSKTTFTLPKPDGQITLAELQQKSSITNKVCTKSKRILKQTKYEYKINYRRKRTAITSSCHV